MSAVRDNSASSCAHQIILFRRDGIDYYACTCGVRAHIPSNTEQRIRATTLITFAKDHLDRVRFRSAERVQQ